MDVFLVNYKAKTGLDWSKKRRFLQYFSIHVEKAKWHFVDKPSFTIHCVDPEDGVLISATA